MKGRLGTRIKQQLKTNVLKTITNLRYSLKNEWPFGYTHFSYISDKSLASSNTALKEKDNLIILVIKN